MSVLDTFNLAGKAAIVTGGTKGLGKAMALAFAEAGANVLICSRTPADCEAVAAELSAATGQQVVGLAADVTKEADAQRLVATCQETWGSVDVLVNSAGINIRHPIEDFPADDFDTIVAINLRGSWLMCKAVSRIMQEQKAGSVINMSSALGLVGLAERTAYCSSKAAIVGLTKTLALEWALSGVRCNALCPGPFMTEINQVLLKDPAKAEKVVGQTAMKRWGQLEEIQGAALFLAADASTYVTGTTLSVDGGWVAG